MAKAKTPTVAGDPEVEAAVKELNTPPTPPAKKKIRAPRLRSADDVRRAGAALYARALRGEIAAADASKLASVLGLALRAMDSDVADRLDDLEERLGGA